MLHVASDPAAAEDHPLSHTRAASCWKPVTNGHDPHATTKYCPWNGLTLSARRGGAVPAVPTRGGSREERAFVLTNLRASTVVCCARGGQAGPSVVISKTTPRSVRAWFVHITPLLPSAVPATSLADIMLAVSGEQRVLRHRRRP